MNKTGYVDDWRRITKGKEVSVASDIRSFRNEAVGASCIQEQSAASQAIRETMRREPEVSESARGIWAWLVGERVSHPKFGTGKVVGECKPKARRKDGQRVDEVKLELERNVKPNKITVDPRLLTVIRKK